MVKTRSGSSTSAASKITQAKESTAAQRHKKDAKDKLIGEAKAKAATPVKPNTKAKNATKAKTAFLEPSVRVPPKQRQSSAAVSPKGTAPSAKNCSPLKSRGRPRSGTTTATNEKIVVSGIDTSTNGTLSQCLARLKKNTPSGTAIDMTLEAVIDKLEKDTVNYDDEPEFLSDVEKLSKAIQLASKGAEHHPDLPYSPQTLRDLRKVHQAAKRRSQGTTAKPPNVLSKPPAAVSSARVISARSSASQNSSAPVGLSLQTSYQGSPQKSPRKSPQKQPPRSEARTTHIAESELSNHVETNLLPPLSQIVAQKPKASKKTHTLSAAAKRWQATDVPDEMVSGDSRICSMTGEVWYADYPPYYLYGDTPYSIHRVSEGMKYDLAKGAAELKGKGFPPPSKNTDLADLEGHKQHGTTSPDTSVIGNIMRLGASMLKSPSKTLAFAPRQLAKKKASFWGQHLEDWKLVSADEALVKKVEDIFKKRQLQSPNKKRRSDEGYEASANAKKPRSR